MSDPKGYHLNKIPKGVLGEPSKIEEEFLEFKDAIQQNNPIMALVELSDLVGAIEAYAECHGISLEQVLNMQKATKRAFISGART